jgi:hypothetical protein
MFTYTPSEYADLKKHYPQKNVELDLTKLKRPKPCAKVRDANCANVSQTTND